MVNLGTESGKVIIKVACRARAGQTLPLLWKMSIIRCVSRHSHTWRELPMRVGATTNTVACNELLF